LAFYVEGGGGWILPSSSPFGEPLMSSWNEEEGSLRDCFPSEIVFLKEEERSVHDGFPSSISS